MNYPRMGSCMLCLERGGGSIYEVIVKKPTRLSVEPRSWVWPIYMHFFILFLGKVGCFSLLIFVTNCLCASLVG